MNGSSSNESFIKSQESIVQGVIRTPKPIGLLKREFNNLIEKYNASEYTKKPIIMLNEEKYEHENSKDKEAEKPKKELKRRKSKKTERKLDVQEHERALNELKKFAFIMDSNNTISKKSHTRDDDDDDIEYEIFNGHNTNSENSLRINSSITLNSSPSNSTVNSEKDERKENNDNSDNQEENDDEEMDDNNKSVENSQTLDNFVAKSERRKSKLVIPNIPNPMFRHHSLSNLKNEVYFSREDVFKNKINNEDDGSEKDDLDDEVKKLTDKKKKVRLKQFLKLHKENFLLEMPNSLYTDIINESVKILTKTSQNYTSQLGKNDESTIGSIKHLEHLKSMIPNGNQYQQHIDNNGGKFGPGYYQLCAPIDENGQYVQLKEKVLINSLESLNSVNK